MRKVIAIAIAGTMSQTSKMPCKSYGLPVSTCNVGGKLRGIPGSACSGCYADKGFYRLYPTVAKSQEMRLNRLETALQNADDARLWIDAVKALIGSDLYFRWHDSGDLIGAAGPDHMRFRHLSLIVQVALEMPAVSFWLPTREKALVADFISQHTIPANLIVRLSAPMIDGAPCAGSTGLNTSTIHRDAEAYGFECGAPSRGGYCGDCRACWNTDVANVSYKFH